jgi:membrane fusion protein
VAGIRFDGAAEVTAHSRIPLFRREVYSARDDRLHGEVNLAVPLSWQLIGYLMFAAVAVALSFLAFASYARVQTVAGTIVVDKGTAPIVPTRDGIVAELAVSDGQHVRAGELLAKIRSEEYLANGSTAPERVIVALDRQGKQLGDQASLVLNAAAADRSRLLDTISGAEAEVQSLDEQIKEQQQLISLAENSFRDAQSVAGKGFITRRDLEDREATLLSRQQQLGQLRQARAEKSTSIAGARRSIAQSDATAQAQAVAIQSQRTQLEQQVAQFDAA